MARESVASYITISRTDPTVILVSGVPDRLTASGAREVAKKLTKLAARIDEREA